MPDTPFNILDLLRELALRRPADRAVIYLRPDGSERRWSFAELDGQVDVAAAGLRAGGIAQGARVLLLTRPDEHFIPFILGLLRAGAVPVLVDPGRPLAEFARCVREARVTALAAPAWLHALSLALPALFGGVRARVVTAGRFPGGGALALQTVLRANPVPPAAPFAPGTTQHSPAAILFTTGSTGRPKGVLYEHATLLAQTRALQAGLHLEGSDIGLFGPSAMMLLGLVSGVTVVVAETLSDSPNRVPLPALVQTLAAYHITLSFASPALCRRLVRYCGDRGLTLPHLRRLMVGGAPLGAEDTAALRRILPGGDVVLSLGATEAMPVTLITGAAALQKWADPARGIRGACVGYPLPGHTLRILPITDGPLTAAAAAQGLPPETVGEIAIRGPVVTRTYLDLPAQDALAKIPAEGEVWHRLGDLGFLDAQGCLWYCGRKSQRVLTPQGEMLYTIPIEQVFNRHPGVTRCALVGLGPRAAQTPLIVVESAPGRFPHSAAQQTRFAAELRELALPHPAARAVAHFAFYPGVFPVDIRHNSKISREKLAAWAQRHPRAIVPPG